MIVIVLILAALCAGVPIIIGWASVDALIGVHTLTADKAFAVIGLCFVVGALLSAIMVVWDGHAGDKHRHERGWTSKPPPPPARDH